MQQTNLINATANLPQINKNKENRFINAAKEIGITAGLGIAGGAIAGGITSLIPTKNTDRISNVLCDAFIRSELNAAGIEKFELPRIDFKNAQEQLQKAKGFIEANEALKNIKPEDSEAKNVMQKIADAAWALKESTFDYINKAAKEDGLLNFAKKEANKIRVKEVMTKSLSIGFATAFIVLLFNTLSEMFNKKPDKK